jgi:hypothetical protein
MAVMRNDVAKFLLVLKSDQKAAAFLRKAAQKFLLCWGHGRCRRRTPWPSINKVFFATFCSQKVVFL